MGDFSGRGIEGQEQVISAPLDELSDVVIFIDGVELVTVLNQAPAQHRHRISHRKIILHVLAGVVVTAHQPSLRHRVVPVRQPRVPSPCYVVILLWQSPRCKTQNRKSYRYFLKFIDSKI